MTYLFRHRQLPDLSNPVTFNELVQIRKLHDRDPRLATFSDKIAVKPLVASLLGRQWVTPSLWEGTTLPSEAPWPAPFVVKSRHGCNHCAFVRDAAKDWTTARRESSRWMEHTFGFWLDEWLYQHIPHGILVESFIGSDGVVPVDYKFFVFGGRVEYIQVHLDRETRHRWLVFDREWRRVSASYEPEDPPPPRSLPIMIDAAETLGRTFSFVRVDLYDLADGPRFGEMTFYPGSGLGRFDPVALDRTMGALWLRALSETGAPPS